MATEKNRRRRALAAVLGILMCVPGTLQARAASETRELIPVGHTVGIKLFSDGVVVVGLEEVETENGAASPGTACGLRLGDVIDSVDGKAVESSEQFAAMLQCGGTVDLCVCREGQDLTLPATPALGADGTYRLGAWVRDSMAGIGTVTFYDPVSGAFGALGHGITDADTGLLLPMRDGAVMGSVVKAVKKGSAGDPGELRGDFDLTEDMGMLTDNTCRGVFGVIPNWQPVAGQPLPVAGREDVRTGRAVIRSNVEGDAVEEYEIRILRLLGSEGERNMLLEVTDPRLLERTGGIVQGMSGSPIIQDGKLVGAVTHVLVNDPTRGYGIFIENMLEAAE